MAREFTEEPTQIIGGVVEDLLGEEPTPISGGSDDPMNSPPYVPVGGVCPAHQDLVATLATLGQAVHDLTRRMQGDHSRENVQLDRVNKQIGKLMTANGIKGYQIANVEKKQVWIAGALGAVAGAFVNLIVWFLRDKT